MGGRTSRIGFRMVKEGTTYPVEDDLPDEIWDWLKDGDDRGDVMTAGSKASGANHFSSNAGIASAHAYTILKVVECEDDGDEFRMIKLRNPWGHKEPTNSDWHDNSQKWKDHPEVARACEHKRGAKNDGIFWVSSEKLAEFFDWLDSCDWSANPCPGRDDPDDPEPGDDEWSVPETAYISGDSKLCTPGFHRIRALGRAAVEEAKEMAEDIDDCMGFTLFDASAKESNTTYCWFYEECSRRSQGAGWITYLRM